MNSNLSQIQKIKENLEAVAFLISKGGAEREAHGRIVQSLVLLSQIETELEGKCSNDPPGKPIEVLASSAASQRYRNIESRNEIDDEVNKVMRRLPRWFRNPSQYNSTILYGYLKLSEKIQKLLCRR